VNSLIDNVTGCWNNELVHEVFNDREAKEILQISLLPQGVMTGIHTTFLV
jgi:hypothetical protein